MVSAFWGLRSAIFLSIVASLAYNFFFLPPIGTFTVADPQNWIALLTFLVTAVIASQLADRARREADNANSRRRELEQLYAFSQQMLTADNPLGLINTIPVKVVNIFGATYAGMLSVHSKKVYYSDLRAQGLIPSDTRNVLVAAASRSPIRPITFASGLCALGCAQWELSP